MGGPTIEVFVWLRQFGSNPTLRCKGGGGPACGPVVISILGFGGFEGGPVFPGDTWGQIA